MMITGRTSFFFATVPVQGMKDGVLHLITSELASELPPGRVERFRLVLATEPYITSSLLTSRDDLDNIWRDLCSGVHGGAGEVADGRQSEDRGEGGLR